MFCDPRLSSVIQYNTMSEKKKGPKEEPDESTLKLLNVYRKKCDQNGVTQVKAIRDRIEAAVEDGKLESVTRLLFSCNSGMIWGLSQSGH